MEDVSDEEIKELEQELKILEATTMNKEDFWKELFKTNKGTTKLNKIEKALRMEAKMKKGTNKCVICNGLITGRSLKGKAITCDQKCAGKLAWKSRNK